MGQQNPIVIAGQPADWPTTPITNLPLNTGGTAVQVAIVSGGGGGSNAAAGPTGSAVPTSADFVGGKDATGKLQGISAGVLTNATALAVEIVDGSGNQITSFGGGTQFADNAASGATPTGTLAMGWDSVNSKVRALKVDASQNLNVNLAANSFGALTVAQATAANLNATVVFASAQHVIIDSATLGTVTVSGTVTSNQGTTPWTIQGDSASGAAKAGNPVQVGGVFNTIQPTVTTGQTVEGQFTARGAAIVATGVDTFTVGGTVTANQGTSPWVDNLTQVASTVLGTPQTFGTAPSGVVIGTSSDIYVAGTRARSNQTTTAAGVIDNNIVGISGTTVVTAAAGVQKVGIVGNTGSTLDSTVGAGAAPTNALAVSGIYDTTQPAPTNTQATALQLDQAANLLTFPGVEFKAGTAWNSSTTINTLQFPTGTATQGAVSGAPAYLVQLDQTSTLTAGAVTFQGTFDNVNWVTIPVAQVLNPNTFAQLTNPFTFVASTNSPFLILAQGYISIRANLTTLITGTGSVTPNWSTLPTNAGLGIQPINVSQVGGSAVSTAAAGIQKVAVLAGGGQTVDAGISAGAAPSRGWGIVGQYNSSAPAPTAAQTVSIQTDSSGSAFVNIARRSATVTQATTISATGATTILAAGAASHFRDMVSLIISVTPQATTASSFTATLSDGTNSYIFDLIAQVTTAAGTTPPLVINFITPLKATTAATAWTLNLSATNTVHVTVVAVDQLAA